MRDTVIKSTAILAATNSILSFMILGSEHWLFAIIAFAVSMAYLTLFVTTNIHRLAGRKGRRV